METLKRLLPGRRWPFNTGPGLAMEKLVAPPSDDVGLVFPEDLPGRHADGEYVVLAGHDVYNTVVDQGLRLVAAAGTQARAAQGCTPDGFELRDIVPVDEGEQRIAL